MQNIIKFINEQIEAGRDSKTIYDYLISKDNPKEKVDAAFDEIFGKKREKDRKSSLEIFVIAGLAMLVLLLVIIGMKIYLDVYEPENPAVVVMKPYQSYPNICMNLVNGKLDCYYKLFEKQDYDCTLISDAPERRYCIEAYEYYADENIY